jgi:hypothetical protein
MTVTDVSAIDLAVMILVDGAIPAVIAPQTIAGQVPVEGRTLPAHEREALGLADPGVTLVYKAGRTDVYLDLGGSYATVWFQGAESASAVKALDASMAKRFPQATLLTDEANPGDPRQRVRHYRLISPDGQSVAELRTTYPAPSVAMASGALFLARVFAQRRGPMQ